MQNSKSIREFERAKKLMPGGVNSPVRAFRNVNSDPIFIKRAEGSKIFDVDGNEFIDYVGSWGPMILGHANARVVAKLKSAVENGTSYGAPTELESELAELVQKFFPSIEMIRMVNSGTEATMSALRLARGYTGRDKILKFIGCYHGHSDSLLVNAGSGAATFGTPSSPGVTAGTAKDTISVNFNDVESFRKVMYEVGQEIAAVIIEPVAGNMGLVLPEENFLQIVRDETEKSGTVLIFDEVMTGFRVSSGGAQKFYNIKPDLTCLGKVIGGGLPCAAYGGRREIMENVSPSGKIYQAGTLSGNPIAMTAGIETLKILLETPNIDQMLADKTKKILDAFKNIAEVKNIPIQTSQAGSMFCVFFTDQPVKNFDDVMKSDLDRFRKYFLGMLDRGIYLAPSQFETLFMSSAHSDDDINRTIRAAESVFTEL